ncbi:ArsR/SmtB family transcription factor [Haloimpatiens massiliensis]|uniref:ArsR/SmtB family transcription factor n=1 Tax=Haloimpatiens massiliensis TaxID=1658110 RepID=UPI0015E0D9C0|nr:metalloregulator ArsR/SmtB family transcription factor [Haloimpatiens massiliensis]
MNNLIDFFKMLSDETRLRIIMLLWQKPLCVCELCYILKLSQPKVSRHLAKLRDIGIVKDDRQSQWIFYYLNIQDETMKDIVHKIGKHIDDYDILKKDLETFKNRNVDYKDLCKRE